MHITLFALANVSLIKKKFFKIIGHNVWYSFLLLFQQVNSVYTTGPVFTAEMSM